MSGNRSGRVGAEGSEVDGMNGNADTGTQPSCDNCLYEYTCDWSKAGERSCCEDYKED